MREGRREALYPPKTPVAAQARARRCRRQEPCPDSQGIDQLDPVKGDVQLAQDGYLARASRRSRPERGRRSFGPAGGSPKTMAWKVENLAPSRQQSPVSPALRQRLSSIVFRPQCSSVATWGRNRADLPSLARTTPSLPTTMSAAFGTGFNRVRTETSMSMSVSSPGYDGLEAGVHEGRLDSHRPHRLGEGHLRLRLPDAAAQLAPVLSMSRRRPFSARGLPRTPLQEGPSGSGPPG